MISYLLCVQSDLPWRCSRHHALSEPYLLLHVALATHDSLRFVSSLLTPQCAFVTDYNMHGHSSIPVGVVLEVSLSAVAAAAAAAGTDPPSTLMVVSAVASAPALALHDSQHMLCTISTQTGQLNVKRTDGSPMADLQTCLNTTNGVDACNLHNMHCKCTSLVRQGGRNFMSCLSLAVLKLNPAYFCPCRVYLFRNTGLTTTLTCLPA